MLQFMYDTLFNKREGNTTYTISAPNSHSIHYTMNNGQIIDDIVIKRKDKKVFTCRLLGRHVSYMEYSGVQYNFCENSLLTRLVKNDIELVCHPNGILLDGIINDVNYSKGLINSCEYCDKLYRRVEGTELYIVYSMGSIDAYIHGVYCVIVTGQGKYIMVANGRIVCHMLSLDTEAVVYWSKNHEDILKSCYGYNPCKKINLLPEQYFDDYYFMLLSTDSNIVTCYNKDIVLKYYNPPKHVITKDFYLLYSSRGHIECMFGYQPNAHLINGNIHGLISVGSEYYYHEGILQWIRNGSSYIVRYSDTCTVRLNIFKDCCVRTGTITGSKRYPFKDGFVSIPIDDGHLDIFYDEGIPKMTTYTTVKNLEPIIKMNK